MTGFGDLNMKLPQIWASLVHEQFEKTYITSWPVFLITRLTKILGRIIFFHVMSTLKYVISWCFKQVAMVSNPGILIIPEVDITQICVLTKHILCLKLVDLRSSLQKTKPTLSK